MRGGISVGPEGANYWQGHFVKGDRESHESFIVGSSREDQVANSGLNVETDGIGRDL